MTTLNRQFEIGNEVVMTETALKRFGQKYKGAVFTVEHIEYNFPHAGDVMYDIDAPILEYDCLRVMPAEIKAAS